MTGKAISNAAIQVAQRLGALSWPAWKVLGVPATVVLVVGRVGLAGCALTGTVDLADPVAGCRRIDDKALRVLESWKALKYLDVQETAVSSASVAGLRAVKPGLEILGGPFTSKASAATPVDR